MLRGLLLSIAITSCLRENPGYDGPTATGTTGGFATDTTTQSGTATTGATGSTGGHGTDSSTTSGSASTGSSSTGGPDSQPATLCGVEFTSITVAEVTVLSDLNTDQDELSPTITDDGMMFAFVSNRPGGSGGFDVYRSLRSNRTVPFTEVAEVVELNSAANESAVGLAGDRLVFTISSDRPGGLGGHDLYVSVRGDEMAAFGAPKNAGPPINTDADERDPSLTGGASTLFYVSGGAPTSPDIALARKPQMDGGFDPPVIVVGDPSRDVSPTLSHDRRTLVFASDRGEGDDLDLWLMRRSGTLAEFVVDGALDELNSESDEVSPALLEYGDGVEKDSVCALYFASNRGGGSFDLYRAALVVE